MNTLIHADIFFFVATIAAVLIAIAIIITLVFVILILKNLHKLSQTANEEADLIAGDIDTLRSRAHSFSWAVAFKLFKKMFIDRFIK